MPRPSFLALLLSLLGGTVAAAQECRGFVPYQRQPIHFSASGRFKDQSSAYVAGIGLGGTAAFGELELGGIDFDASGASSVLVGGAAGVQLPLNQRRTAQLCPIAELSFAKGSRDVVELGSEYRETDFSLGLTAGFFANGSGHEVEIIPTGSIAYANTSGRLTRVSGSVTSDQTFEVVALGVGFVFGRDLSVTPSVSQALWVGGASTTVGVRVVVALGRARPAVIAGRPTSCAGLSSTDSTVYDTTQVSERPILRTAPEPMYPPLQRDLAIGGRVIMSVVVGSDGTTDRSSVQVVQRVDPAIDREALRWIGNVSYWPACRAGQPVRARIAQPLDFCAVRCPGGKS